MMAVGAKTPKPSKLPAVGWREYVALPGLGVERVKAKVDTGARSCALHAINILYVTKHGATHVRFEVHPKQRSTKRIVHCEARLLEERLVTDSGGKRTLRPVILAEVVIAGKTVAVELTLVSRDEMGFRMLIGRQALKGSFVVDPGRSYLGGGRLLKKKKKKVKP